MNVNPNAVSPSKIVLFALCSLFAALPFAWGRSNAAIQAFNSGVKAFNAKDFNAAIPLFDDAISNDSEFADAYFARGACKYYLKSLDGAMMDMNDALRLKSDYLDAYSLRGAINYESDRWDAAVEDFNYVLSKNPHDAQALLGRAVILLKREDLAGAQKDFKEFLKARPDDPLAPKIHQLLASLRGAAPEPKPQESEQTSAQAPVPSPHRATSSVHHLSAADLQKLADSLLSRSFSESYDQQVLHGQKAEVTGDIHSRSGVPGDEKPADSGVTIVDPR